MAENKKKKDFDLPHSVDKAEIFYLKNSKTINVIGLIIIALVGGYFGYKYLYMAPREKRAEVMVYKAQQYFGVDSFRLALNGDGNNYGFLQVIRRYGNTRVGNLSRYYAGVCYVRMGDFQQAIPYLKQFDLGDQVVQAMDYGILGDAYMETGNSAEGISYYLKAAHYHENDLISPFYLKRAALACEKVGRVSQAIEYFKEIKSKYPNSTEGRDIEKYLARLGDLND